jgi:flagellar biogenesis protein FliO
VSPLLSLALAAAESPAGTPSPAPGLATLAPAGLLLALAVAAVVVARRRRPAARRMLEVVESASLGPRRSLVVARVGGELLVLGVSEAGIALLSSGPAAAAPTATPGPAPASTPGRTAPARGVSSQLSGLLSRLRPQPAAPAPEFEAALAESLEDAELRRKLAQGGAGVVR